MPTMIATQQYRALSEFRYHLARFLRFSERASRNAGITPTQYLLLLHIRGFPQARAPNIGELAERLQSSPHGTATLIARCVGLRLVRKRRSAADRRRVAVLLRPRGRALVERIARRHRDELHSLRSIFRVANVS
jgi:DNA-binding MarR family transcriptional regulator